MTSKETTGNDPLDDLKRAMAQAMPAPDAARREANLARSQEIFATHQGSLQAARQNSATPTHRGFFAGVFDMLFTRTTGALTATTALVAVGLLYVSPLGEQLLRAPGPLVPTGGTAIPEISEPLAQAPRAVPPVIAAPTTGDTFAATEAAPVPAPSPSVAADAVVLPVPVPLVAPEAEGARRPEALAATTPLTSDADAADLSGTLNAEASADGIGTTSPADAASGRAIVAAPAPVPGNQIAASPARIQAIPPLDATPAPLPDSEEFANESPSPLRLVADEPVSTFSIDVDTAAYALLRSTLNRGQLPAPDAIRIEEMVNYFPYDYPAPDAGDVSPFRPTVQVFPTPWNPDTQLVHIGIQGILPAIEDRPALNLVFLIDTSGSMNDPAKLPLLIQSFRLMLDRLNPEDQVAIVTYAGSAGVALEPTSAADTVTISRALTALQAGGSTNGVGGLQVAYDLAAQMTGNGEVSRVLLATDGDFNIGISDPEALENYIAEQRETGIYLSVLGFGRGNLQDDTMQALAQNGNGTAAYIDTLHEAQRVLVDQLAGALFPIADDLKVQVEFNPAVIAEYRLIGYETRALAREDFANDAVDAGELGAGHSVTAIYEVTPVGSPALRIAPLRYAAEETTPIRAEFAEELGFISLRWKAPGAADSQLVEFPISATTGQSGTEAQFAAAIAGFGELLRGSDFLGDWNYSDAIALANANRGADAFGYRAEAVQLMRLAQSLAQ